MFTNFENMALQPERTIRFFFLKQGLTLKNRKGLKNFLVGLLKQEGRKPVNINFIFCSDEYLLDINKKYLKHVYYTDIITFDLSENPRLLEAEIYISVDRIRDNANILNVTLKEETLRVIFHGLLHLCGYNDKSKMEKLGMREREKYYINKFNNICST